MSGWPPDNYSAPLQWPGYQDRDWRESYRGHACFDPTKVRDWVRGRSWDAAGAPLLCTAG